MTAIPDRLPPHNRDAERSLLSSMLRDNAVIADVAAVLSAAEFYTFAHQRIFEAIVDLDFSGQPADMLTVADWLTKRNRLEDVGGLDYLAELWDASPSAAHFASYAEMVREKATARRLIHVATEILAEAYSPTSDPDQQLAAAERKILDIAERSVVGSVVDARQVVREFYARLDERAQAGGAETSDGVPTGYLDLDTMTAGFHNSELIVVGARPSVGKTAFALNVTRNVVLAEKLPVFFVSLEQRRVELAERLVCAHARIDGHVMRKGWLDDKETERVHRAGDDYEASKFFFDDTPRQTVMRIGANARRLKRSQGIRLIVVDYMQLIEPENPRANKNEQISHISRQLKLLARELDLPVIVLSQLNRSSEETSRRPKLSDLRDSGAIEQDADTVLLMHRTAEGPIDILIEKQRHGPVGEVKLIYHKEFLRFENFAHDPRM